MWWAPSGFSETGTSTGSGARSFYGSRMESRPVVEARYRTGCGLAWKIDWRGVGDDAVCCK